MKKRSFPQKLTCLLFGEGKKEKNFLSKLIELPQFKFHTIKWQPPMIDHASGSSPGDVLDKCQKIVSSRAFNLVLCFLDLDVLKKRYPKSWEKEIKKLEEKYPNIKIIWQEDNLEDILKRTLSVDTINKHNINREAKKNITKFLNTDYWKAILKCFKDKQKEFE